MASRGASRPVQTREAAGALAHEHLEPVDEARAALLGPARDRSRRVAVDEVDHDAGVDEREAVERVVARAGRPRWRSRAARPARAARPPRRRARSASASARSAVRFQTRHLRAGARERPDRRRGRRRRRRARARVAGGGSPSASSRPPASVLSPAMPPVLVEASACSRRRSRAAASLSSSASSSAASLCGIVTLAAAVARAGERADGLREPLGRDRQREVAPVEPELREGRVHHRGRAAVPDGEAEDARERAQHFVGDLPPRASRARLYSFT